MTNLTEHEKFNLWDEVYFTPKAHYWNIVQNNTLYQLRPKQWIIISMTLGDGIFNEPIYAYTIKTKGFKTYNNIHTCYKTLDDYYEWIANEIIEVWKINKTIMWKFKNAISLFYNK